MMSRTHAVRYPGGALLIALAVSGLALPATAAAQSSSTPEIFYACYVPGSGVVYRIKGPGLPQQCSGKGSAPHVEFSWTEGVAAHDHGALNGLTDDDHKQYLLVDAATRSLVAGLDAAGYKITGLAAATAAGEAVRYEQAVKNSDAAGGDLSGTFPDPVVAKLQGSAVSTAAPTDGQVLTWDGTSEAWTPAAPDMAVSDHGGLGGLTDDDHPQYLLSDGTRALAGDLSAGGFKVTDLAPGTATGDAVRFEQAVKNGDAAGGDLSGEYPSPTVAGLRGVSVSSTPPASGQVLSFDGTAWAPSTPMSGTSDHGGLDGLADDDHPQYLLADGIRNATSGFAVTGTLGTGTIPAAGAGTRMMWYPGKAAFRAGRAFTTEWDDANVGLQSVALGSGVTASGEGSVALGYNSQASGRFAIAIGPSSRASGDVSRAMGNLTFATGLGSTAIGTRTTASGDQSMAMGVNASTNEMTGSFVYGDFSHGVISDMNFVRSTAPNQFMVRAAGGTIFYSDRDLTAGVSLAPGAGAWASVSDVNRKENFQDVDGEEVLQKISRMPIREWNYRAQDASIRHLGPTAQDFFAAFGLGEDQLTITTSDIDGINLRAIQALEQRTRELREKAAQVEALSEKLAELERRLAAAERQLRQ